MKTIEALFADWQAAEARASRPGVTDTEVEAICDETRRIEEAMMLLPSITLRDMALKIGVLSGFGNEDICAQVYPGIEPFWAEVRALAGMPPIAAPMHAPERRAALDAIIEAQSRATEA